MERDNEKKDNDGLKAIESENRHGRLRLDHLILHTPLGKMSIQQKTKRDTSSRLSTRSSTHTYSHWRILTIEIYTVTVIARMHQQP